MSIVLSFTLFVVGLILIIFAGDKFVDASVTIAKRLGASEILIGATIVSLGTTLPEMLVSTTASIAGNADIATGNAFGSIICNTAFIAGLTQLIKPSAKLRRANLGWGFLFFLAGGAVCLLFGLGTGHLGLQAGLLLFSILAIYIFQNISSAKDGQAKKAGAPQTGGPPLFQSAAILVVTAILLYFGAKLLVENGELLAIAIGVPERVIGVTFIALGTSLPELVTAITSLVKGHSAVSVGNIIGANILNFLLVIGIPAVLCGITPSVNSVFIDLPIALLVMSFLILPMIARGKGSRIQGALLVAFYFAYSISLF